MRENIYDFTSLYFFCFQSLISDVAYGPGYTDVENYYDIFEEAAKLFPYNGK